MSPTEILEIAHSLATDIKVTCDEIYATNDPEDLRVMADEVMCLALKLDNFILEHVTAPLVAMAETGRLDA